jgi:hypothetical protein
VAATCEGCESDPQVRVHELPRKRIMLWAGSKGELLQKILDVRDSIAESDQISAASWDTSGMNSLPPGAPSKSAPVENRQ